MLQTILSNLTSKKLWVTVIGLVLPLILGQGFPTSELLVVITYIIGQSAVDVAKANQAK